MNKIYAHLDITKKKLEDLKDHQRNPRIHPNHQYDTLVSSIERFGYAKGSIVVQKDTNIIIAGHAIRESLMDSGYEYADVIEVDWDDIKALAFLTADNQYALLGQWDYAQRDNNIAKLQNEGFEIEELGFDVEEIEPEIDYDEMWEGMPEFEQEDVSGFMIKVHFENEEDIADFAKLIGQKLTTKTKSIWYPEKEDLDLINYQVIDDESE